MISVTAEGVLKTFGTTVALDRISLRIEPGELFFLLGPSGCGKTTLLRCIAGFYIPESGRILFDQEDVTSLAPHKRNTGMMFQSYALWPHMTVEENVAFGLEQQKKPRSEIKRLTGEALESVKMSQYATRKPNQLSGGQQQRVALARALVIRPRCLLLDEPLSNLDAKLRMEMRGEIRRVCKEFQLTTIYVTHDQKEALSVADRMAVLDKGKILQIGTPREVYRRPRNRFVADFIGDTNFIEGTVLRVGGGFAQVQTAVGEFNGVLANPESEPSEGAKVTLSLRPECLHLENMPVDENCFTGRIGEATYYGEVAQYLFKTGGPVDIKIFELNPRFLGGAGDGDLYAWIDAEDVIVLNG
ncbi:MAG: ABC transporter ATP-binding protein [Verrucomicrobiota bacterium]|nr:ABC transporter ATP-binding protein [Verrucomicrobiota bacterium]